MADDPRIGKTFGGCKLLRRLGAGAMGEVYQGHHVRLDRPVAVKILVPRLAADPHFVTSFLREARAAAKLEHPNIVQVHDVGEQGGEYFIVMQYLDGGDLGSKIARDGRIGLRDAVDLARGVLDGLGAAHAKGVVHRDVKPSNILLDELGRPKLADFGLAQDASGETGSDPGVVGTAYFMAPEQAQGRAADARSDLYAIGVTLYHMLTGRLPFAQGSAVEIMHQHLQAPVPAPSAEVPDLPMAVDRLVRRLMAKDPGQRFQDAAAVVEALDHVEEWSGDENEGLVLLPAGVGLEMESGGDFYLTGEKRAAAPSVLLNAPVLPGSQPGPAPADERRAAGRRAAFYILTLAAVAGSFVFGAISAPFAAKMAALSPMELAQLREERRAAQADAALAQRKDVADVTRQAVGQAFALPTSRDVARFLRPVARWWKPLTGGPRWTTRAAILASALLLGWLAFRLLPDAEQFWPLTLIAAGHLAVYTAPLFVGVDAPGGGEAVRRTLHVAAGNLTAPPLLTALGLGLVFVGAGMVSKVFKSRTDRVLGPLAAAAGVALLALGGGGAEHAWALRGLAAAALVAAVGVGLGSSPGMSAPFLLAFAAAAAFASGLPELSAKAAGEALRAWPGAALDTGTPFILGWALAGAGAYLGVEEARRRAPDDDD